MCLLPSLLPSDLGGGLPPTRVAKNISVTLSIETERNKMDSHFKFLFKFILGITIFCIFTYILGNNFDFLVAFIPLIDIVFIFSICAINWDKLVGMLDVIQ